MITQKVTLKLYSGTDTHAFFGSGPYTLLLGIDQTHSIAKASRRMKMAYTKALAMLRRAEDVLGAPLVRAQTGGKGGGGSELTETGRNVMEAYARCLSGLEIKSRSLFDTHFNPILK